MVKAQLNGLTLVAFAVRYDKNPDEDTEPRVQRLFIGSYLERDIWPQGLADAGFCGWGIISK